jgi:hypothetical protein
MPEKSNSVIEALDRMREALALPFPAGASAPSSSHPRTRSGDVVGFCFPNLVIGPLEEVLIFDVVCRASLTVESATDAYFHVWGNFIEINGTPIVGGTFDTVFPLKIANVSEALVWPDPQWGPFDRPPVHHTHTGPGGYSKTSFAFGDGSEIVTVGPSIPKLVVMREGPGQLWVTSVGVITGGRGRYAGAKGLCALNGSGYFPTAPDFSTPEGRQILIDGFPVKVSVNFKLIGSA